MKRVLTFLMAFIIAGCASQRVSYGPGDIPLARQPTWEDQQVGQDVLRALSQEYRINTNPAVDQRVEAIVNKLTAQTNAAGQVWKVYVFQDDNIKNAAATRGNYIFIWTGLTRSLKTNHELATVVAHEIAHVLADHALATSDEEVNSTLANIAGVATRTGLAQGSYYHWGGLAGAAAMELVKGLIVYPESQRKEHEADQIGLFLMAKAGFNPEKAVDVWTAFSKDPQFQGGVTFLSTHPATRDRLESLRELLPAAMAEYRKAGNSPSFTASAPPPPAPSVAHSQPAHQATGGFVWGQADPTPQKTLITDSASAPSTSKSPVSKTWVVVESGTDVFISSDGFYDPYTSLMQGQQLTVDRIEGRWLKISVPVQGYVKSTDCAPFTP